MAGHRAPRRQVRPRAAPAGAYPLKEYDLANRVAVLAESQDWCPDYVRAAYRHWFELGAPPGVDPGLTDALNEIGRDPAAVVAAAQAPAVEERYRRNTEEAKALGVFGSPTFVVKGEVFWGDDRLEDAIEWFNAKA